jgi:hypothetical protein
MPLPDLQDALDAAWDAFKTNTSFWVLGHAYDTILDALTVLTPAGGSPKTEYMQGALDKFGTPPYLTPGQTPMKGESWYDDDGWWIISSLKAYHLCDIPGWEAWKGAGQPTFLDFCLYKWARCDTHAPKVFEESVGHKDTLHYLFDHGVWNSTWPKEPADAGWPGDCKPFENGSQNLCGFQNTVTNTLYLIAAERLRHAAAASSAKAFGDAPTFGEAADREYGFLKNWFNPSAPEARQAAGVDTTNVTPILNRLNGTQSGPVVIRERVTCYQNLLPPFGYDPAQAWTGDQGLLLGGLVERMKDVRSKEDEEYGKLLRLAKDLILGVGAYLTDGEGMLLSWPGGMASPGSLPDAYATGFGAFLRYLVHAYRTNEDLRNFCNSTESAVPGQASTFSAFIANMPSIFPGVIPLGGTQSAYTMQCVGASDLTMAINALALRVAAQVMGAGG